MKFKSKSTGTKRVIDLGEQLKIRQKVIQEVVANVPQLDIKEKKVKSPARKVVYISKCGSRAVFDSVGLCAKIFKVDKSTIRYKIEHPVPKKKATLKGGDWLEGGRLEYIN